jgi:hypothetical protein
MCREYYEQHRQTEVKQETAADKAAKIAQQTAVTQHATGSLPVQQDEAHYEAHR